MHTIMIFRNGRLNTSWLVPFEQTHTQIAAAIESAAAQFSIFDRVVAVARMGNVLHILGRF